MDAMLVAVEVFMVLQLKLANQAASRTVTLLYTHLAEDEKD